MRTSIWISAFASMLLLSSVSSAETSGSTDYLKQLVAEHDDVFAARIISGAMVFSGGGDPCYYKYVGRVFQTFLGGNPQKDFSFFSEAHLLTGGDYLLFLSKKNAKVYRSAATPETTNGRAMSRGNDCKKRMTGYFLLGNETGLLKFIEKDKKAVQVVEFEDPLADFPPAVTSVESVRAVDYEYVVSNLKK